MTGLRKFFSLAPADRRLLLRAMLAVQLVKMGLGVLPLRALRRLVMCVNGAGRYKPLAGPPSADRIAWAVGIACRRTIGRTTCLVKALATQVMLVAQGHAARLHLGVARGEGGGVQAHAWVECRGGIVVGGPAREIERYVPLLALGPETP